ncbi:methylated-DNA--[protein]-cysteine S-methyltransferase [Sphingobacterium sp. DK4209]|uniref:Methylated-DNA--[protein]-cysteine S-methyltransferase n=1 Tax=Sphingobacterium zhuxiongii TaxID=2662364 RepID=A0A5Q0QEK4_9SPHI|nr:MULTISPECIES: methylated-DNA--[protein]-cysteine S-methyltransferase [unclassified Sphingobacterium]MVZ65471.1 methylated-DNA--[protein]-cysteine S-methyltransferase [Sphingobacterium sp. DK4209]QGA27381.1 methylated-DNA--[protein]-cysteine S-methyltransferase [Sphingobacterium sp. dk4302]
MEKTQQAINYDRIAQAIQYIQNNFQRQPNLEQIAEHVHLSPFHFQRMFTEWAGTSPKKFLQYIQVDYAKKLLKEEQRTLFDTHLLTGFSSTSRLHDLFVQIEGMTPAEYKNGAEGLQINYSFQDTPFGTCLIASTKKGICHLAFSDNPTEALLVLKSQFENASYIEQADDFHQSALAFFNPQTTNPIQRIKLHLKGSPFQLKVWQALLEIPSGQLKTYKSVAIAIEHPKASRAVGTAIGQNPIAYLIPCHRVIQTSGKFGGYRWQPSRKTAIIGWEIAKHNAIDNDETI